MQRRDGYRQLLCAGLLWVCAALSAAWAAGPEAQARRIVQLDSGWRFHFGAVEGDPTAATFDDSPWQLVSVPHTWNRLGEQALARSTATNNDRGIGWYRLKFSAPAISRTQRQFLQFDAVGTRAEVWLNGVRVGAHAGAFSRFRFDVTEFLKPGTSNVLVVKADNSKPAPGSSTQDVIPLAGDFFIHGGLYRDVSLITTDNVHIDLLDYAGPGLYAHTSQLSAERADIAVLARMRNDDRHRRTADTVIRILDNDGREVARTSQTLRIAPRSGTELRANLLVRHPRRWHGRADPYLYRVSVELRDEDRTLDFVEEPLGIRSIRVDPDAGLFLNNERIQVRGVSRHQDRAGKGWALSAADHEQDMALIAELGANAVRFAHYQHAPKWFELADRYGMLVWSEVPFVNEANFTDEEPTAALIANARQQLLEEIRQNYNHPSVFTWSVGNEIDIGHFMRARKAGKSLSLLSTLNALAKSEDPHRLTTFADCCEPPPMTIPNAEALAGTTDLIGYNRYFGWYYGKPEDLGSALDELHRRHPRLPIGVSEYGAGAAISQHTDNERGGVLNMLGRPHPEEVQNLYHERAWPQIASRPFVWGSFIWNMFDFASDLREEGDAVDINNKGLVSYDRQTKKDAFFYYKAQWSAEPVVHIASERHVDRAYPVTDVRVYSNAARVRLQRNGEDLGWMACESRVCAWRDVELRTGPNTLVASAEFNGTSVLQTVKWNGPDAERGLVIDSGNLTGHRDASGRLMGSDHFFVGGEAKLLNGLSAGGFGVRDAARRKSVSGTADAPMFEGYREGAFAYDVPLSNGEWTIKLHSFESVERLLDSRTFDVIANDRPQIRAWNPGRSAGGAFKAADISFKVRVEDGHLRLKFVPVGGAALIAAIEILPRARHETRFRSAVDK